MISPLGDLDLACGLVLGFERRLPRLPDVPPGLTPLRALEQAILPALAPGTLPRQLLGWARLVPPCSPSPSRWRDVRGSPIRSRPRTASRTSPPAPRRSGRSAVVGHLGLSDWLRLEFTDELDAVGPYAQRVMRRHGVLWPFNAHFHVPLFEAAAGGSLLTGVGGDQLFMAACPAAGLHGADRAGRPAPRATC
jgi:asparagine synthase (glutamine-hydrolysing)